MKFIKISNNGMVEQKAFTMIGASTKRQDSSKIGWFGSGNKYSIAYLLRNNIRFHVFSGTSEIKFTVKKEGFREQDFDLIYVNDEKTSLTTGMGSGDWQPFSVVRETFCNAVDEGGEKIEIVGENDIIPEEGKTTIFIQVSEDIQEVMDNWNLYFSDKRDDLQYYDAKENKLFSGGHDTIVYRKGIQCFQTSEQRSIFHYDMQWVEINESRVIKNDWSFRWELSKFLQKIKDIKIVSHIYTVMNGKSDMIEFDLHWDSNVNCYSEAWQKTIGERYLVSYETAGLWDEVLKETPHIILPSKMVRGLKEKFADKVKILGEDDGVTGGDIRVVKELSKRQEFMLKESEKFFEECKYKVNYPIKVCRFSDPARLGMAKDKTIYIAERVFEMGRRMLSETIIEENEHLESGHEDKTRAFQDHLIRKFVSQMEERFGYFL